MPGQLLARARELVTGRPYTDASLDLHIADAAADIWREACIGAGLCTVVQTVTGPTEVVPRVLQGVPPAPFVIGLLPGQLIGDVRAAAPRLAGHLGAALVRVTSLPGNRAKIEPLVVDPLSATVELPRIRPGRVFVGRTDEGHDLIHDWHRAGHTAVQGVTRSGKSVWTYGALAQLARDPLATITGTDPTGLLWRPFAGTRHEEWQVSGLQHLDRVEHLLVRLVDDMDRRIANLPMHRDTIEITAADPMRVVVLEEHAGLLRSLDAADKDAGKRVRALIARLLAEGAKVGIRVIILVQRAEAAVIGAFERAMCSVRISFRTDNRASVELLHPGAPPDVADAHSTAAPGVALISEPGRPLTRMRAPFMGGYAEYVAAVRSA
jgi:hypothetical protein